MKNISLFLLVFLLVSCGTEPTPIYTLNASVNGEGNVTPSYGEFESGTEVTITGQPGAGWTFVNWDGDASGSSSSVTITMDSDKNVAANFQRKNYPLTIYIEGEGTVNEAIISQPKTTDYTYETIVELTPVPSNSWVFSHWEGALSGTENPVQVTIDSEKIVTAIFHEVPTWKTLMSSLPDGITFYETAYNRSENIIYASGGGDFSLIYRINVNDNTVTTLSTSGKSGRMDELVYDPANNRLLGWRAGRDVVYQLNFNDNSWSQVSNGAGDASSYGASAFYDVINDQVSFFAGYGGASMKNWIWGNNLSGTSEWLNVSPDQNNESIGGIPRGNANISYNSDYSKIFINQTEGSYSGRQTDTSCTIGHPWYTDIGIWCWLRNVWEYDIESNTFVNIRPNDDTTQTRFGAFVYNYDSEQFFIIGGRAPFPDRLGFTDFNSQVLMYDRNSSEGFSEISLNGTTPSTNYTRHQAYYDSINRRILWIRDDGLYAIEYQ